MGTARTIRSWLETQQPRLLDLLQRLVNIESHAAHRDGVASAAATLIRELEPIGFEFDVTSQAPLAPSERWLEELFSPGVRYSELGSTYASFAAGTAPGRLLLLGDLDTAFPVGSLADFPFRIEGARAYGPGIADMKGGLVVLVAALQALDQLGLDRPDIALVLAGDEQAGSLGSRPVIEQAGERADWCLCVECGRRGGKLMAARGHIGVGMLRISGVEAHTGSARQTGVNALQALARLVIAFDALTDPEEGTLVTVTIARAGRRRSIVPALAEATVDIRTREPGRWQETTTAMRRLTVEVSGDTGAEVDLRIYNHRPGVIWDEQTDRLLGLVRALGSELSIDVEAFASAAAGSSAFSHPSTTVLDGLGPLGADLMTQREHIEIDSLVPRAALLAELIHQLPTLLD